MPSNKISIKRKKQPPNVKSTHQHATDKLKKSLNITRTPSNSTINPNLTTATSIITETASDSKYRDHLAAKVAENKLTRADKRSKST